MATEHPAAWLRQRAATHGDDLALSCDDFELTWRAMHRRIAGAAARYRAAGWRPGARTAVVADSPADMVLGVAVSMHLGSPVLPLAPDSRLLPEVLEPGLVEQALGRNLAGTVPSFPLAWVREDGDEEPAPEGWGDGPCLLVSTSGTTSSPRVAALGPPCLAAATTAASRALGFGAGDRWLACVPMDHVGGLSVFLRALRLGGAAVLSGSFEPGAVMEILRRKRVTHVSMVPATLVRMVEAGHSPPSSLRSALVGGGPLAAGAAARAAEAGWPVFVGYGMTETAAAVCIAGPVDARRSAGDVGRPLPGVSADVVDDAGQPTEGPGLLRLRGPQLMDGYLDVDGRLVGAPGADGFVTRDRALRDSSGRLTILGRADGGFTSGGTTIHPDELEAVLEVCPGVEEVVVAGVPDPKWEHLVVAVYAGSIGEAELARWCTEHCPRTTRPRRFVRLDALPANRLGKPDRKAVKALAEARHRDPADPPA